MNLNQYSLYSMNVGLFKVDEVDDIVKCIKTINNYDEAMNYIMSHFGNIETEKEFNYPDIDKQIAIVLKKNAVEFFAGSKRKQYFGKGWKKAQET